MKVVFTSCMDAIKVHNQPVWQKIQSLAPDALLLLGDQIYMDWTDVGPSEWKKKIKADGGNGSKAVQRFVQEMHRRYEAQARVPAFAALMRDMKARNRPVYMTWDDHDFAWNNATGEAPQAGSPADALDDWSDHGVPFSDVKQNSAHLFAQFSQFDFQDATPYPPLTTAPAGNAPPNGCCSTQSWPQPISLPGGPSVDVMMLDTRFFRTPRQSIGSTILGRNQLAALKAAARQANGLLIVGGGTPMRHRYLLGKQDWSGGHGDEYVDFEEFLNSATRPILYLSGDVHFNAWGGPVRRFASEKSHVVQILATPAAIDNIFAKEFPSSFGILDIDTATVTCELFQADDNGQFVTSPGERTRVLHYTNNQWTEVANNAAIDGAASEEVMWLHKDDMSDTDKMAVICCVPRKSESIGDALSAQLDHLENIDSCFKETLNAAGGPAQGPAPLKTDALFAQVSQANQSLELSFASSFDAVFEHAFKAAESRSTSVVFHIHGVGKTPTDAIDQGYALRRLFGCEPIVFCWPVGVTTGRFGAIMAPGKAAKGIASASPILLEIIKDFAQTAWEYHNRVPSIILARSAGAELLRTTLAGGASNSAIHSIRRIVLSSPACTSSLFDAKHGNAFNMGDTRPTIVTINRLDRALRMADWGMNGEPLGQIDPSENRRMPAVNYIKFDSVGALHDYLLIRVSQEQYDLNKAMLTQFNFDPSSYAPPLMPDSNRRDIFTLP